MYFQKNFIIFSSFKFNLKYLVESKMSFSNYNNDLNIFSRKMNLFMNPNLVEKDEQSPFNNSHILIQGQSDNNHIFYSQ